MENNTKNLPAVVNLPCKAEDQKAENIRQEEELCRVEIEALRQEIHDVEEIADEGTKWADEQIVDLNIRIDNARRRADDELEKLTDEEYLELESLCGIEFGQRTIKAEQADIEDEDEDFGEPDFEDEDEDAEFEPVNREERRRREKEKKKREKTRNGLKQLYLKIAKRVHPDVFIEGTYGLSKAEASELFKQAAQAFRDGDATVLMRIAQRLALEEILDITNVLDELLEERNRLRAHLESVMSLATYNIGKSLRQIKEMAEAEAKRKAEAEAMEDVVTSSSGTFSIFNANVTASAGVFSALEQINARRSAIHVNRLRDHVRHAVMPQVNQAEIRQTYAELGARVMKAQPGRERGAAMAVLFNAIAAHGGIR